MSGLQITITTAGRAALVNAEHTGTAPVRIAQVGLSTQSFAPAAGMTSVPGELKRIATVGGQAVALDTLHVTIRDDTADTYSLRGFGLYLDNGTLFAVYSQPSVIMEKSSQSLMLLAADLRFVDLTATSISFGNAEWSNPPATTTVQGVVELADTGEAIAGTDSTRALTPAGLKAAIDARIGPDAPSALVKGVLALATALAIRTAIGLGNAAVRNEGAGNGLDADLLDGQHGAYYRDWANLTGKPATFAPSAHTHDWTDLGNVPATALRWPSFNEVTGKPATYPPSGHTHSAADVTSGVFDIARIPDVGISKVIGLQTALDSKAPLNNPQLTGTGIKVGANNAGESNIAFGVDDWYLYSNAGNFGLFSASKGSGWSFAKADKSFSVNGQAVWHAGNFNPATKANKAGETFTGNVTAPNLIAGGAGNGAYVQVGDDARLVDVGDQHTMAVQSTSNGNVGFLRFGTCANRFGWDGGNLMWGGALMWHSANFDPNSKATNGATVSFADITASRGNGTGVIFLGRGDRYVHWDGGSYVMPGGQLVVEGGFQKGSSRELKIIDGPLPYGLAELMHIETAIGSYKREFMDDGGRKRLFVIAEQLAEVVPEPVFAEAIAWGDRRVAAVDDGQLVPLLVKAVQQLAERVFALEGRT